MRGIAFDTMLASYCLEPGLVDRVLEQALALDKGYNVTIESVPEVAGDATYNVPDIQATAIRLKDAAIVGQAAASDVKAAANDIASDPDVKEAGTAIKESTKEAGAKIGRAHV